MFGTATKTHAIELIKQDHKKVKELFQRFEEEEDGKEKKRIVDEALRELTLHAEAEESVFYPAVREEADVEEDVMNEADEEHHVAKLLIAEIEGMKGTESHFEAKFLVLAENVKHHIKEEEGEILPEAGKADIDFEALGEKFMERKEQFISQGMPKPAEARMVAKSAGKGDSPAHRARKSGSSKRKG